MSNNNQLARVAEWYRGMSEKDRAVELWKDVPGWIGLYRVSTHGRVKSMERIIKSDSKDKIVRSRFMLPGTDKDGYLNIQLSKDGVTKNMRVHRLVALAFIPNPLCLPLVNHIDNDVKNNHVWNLEWATPLSNLQHSANQGRKVAPNKKINYSDIPKIKSLYAQGGITMDKIASMYNVTRPVIGYIINNKSYKNVK